MRWHVVALLRGSLLLHVMWLFGGAVQVRAQSLVPNVAYTQWYLDEASVKNPVAPVKGMHAFFHARLIPGKLYQIEDTLSIPESDVVFEKGSQFVGLNSSKSIGCSVNSFGEISKIKMKNRDWIFVCLIDRDADGRFDGYSYVESNRYDIFNATIENFDAFSQISEVFFKEISASDIKKSTYLHFLYTGTRGWIAGYDKRTFGITFNINSDSDSNWIFYRAVYIEYKMNVVPARFKYFGVDFEILEFVDGRPIVKRLGVDKSYEVLSGFRCCIKFY